MEKRPKDCEVSAAIPNARDWLAAGGRRIDTTPVNHHLASLVVYLQLTAQRSELNGTTDAGFFPSMSQLSFTAGIKLWLFKLCKWWRISLYIF